MKMEKKRIGLEGEKFCGLPHIAHESNGSKNK
jgi:hypothetical protein